MLYQQSLKNLGPGCFTSTWPGLERCAAPVADTSMETLVCASSLERVSWALLADPCGNMWKRKHDIYQYIASLQNNKWGETHFPSLVNMEHADIFLVNMKRPRDLLAKSDV